MSSKMSSGDKLMADGDKAMKTGLFKWKPDLDYAAECYDKAGMQYKLARNFERGKLAYTKAADAHKDNGSLFHGGKALENAAGLAKDLKKMPESINLLRDAAGCYRQAGQGDTAAAALEKAAKQAEQTNDLDSALDMYLECVDIQEGEDRPRQCKIPLAKAVAISMRKKDLSLTTKLLSRQAALFVELDNVNNYGQTALSQVIIHLLNGDYVAADRSFSGATAEMPSVVATDEGVAAMRLLDAFENEDATALAACQQEQVYTFLDNEIALAVRKLTIQSDDEFTGAGSAGSSKAAAGAPVASKEQEAAGSAKDARAALFAPSKKSGPAAPPAEAAPAAPAPSAPPADEEPPPPYEEKDTSQLGAAPAVAPATAPASEAEAAAEGAVAEAPPVESEDEDLLL